MKKEKQRHLCIKARGDGKEACNLEAWEFIRMKVHRSYLYGRLTSAFVQASSCGDAHYCD